MNKIYNICIKMKNKNYFWKKISNMTTLITSNRKHVIKMGSGSMALAWKYLVKG